MQNVLIIYSKDQTEVLNRKSAIGSYIHTLAALLFEELELNCYINGDPVQQLVVRESEPNFGTISTSNSLKNRLKKLIPGSIKQRINEKRLFKNQEELLLKLMALDIKFDHILEFYTIGSEVGFQLSKAKGIPLSVVYDSPVIEQEEFFKNVKVAFPKKIIRNEKNTLETAENILVYSVPVQEFLKSKYELVNTNFIIRQNVDFSRIDYLSVDKGISEGIHICFLGSFLKWHRVDLLISVFEKLASQFDNIYLDLIGEGMEFQNIKNIVDRSNYQSRITLPGFLDGSNLKAYKERMHIGIMPGSNWYGAPNKIFEYGAAGMAVVSCKSPTICDMFSDQEIVFFEMGNENELYDAIRKLISSPDNLKNKASRLQDFILQEHNKEKTVTVYKNIF